MSEIFGERSLLEKISWSKLHNISINVEFNVEARSDVALASENRSVKILSKKLLEQNMANYDIDFEKLLGRQVVDPTGKTIGRIEEVRAEKQGEEWVMQVYIIGTIGMLERLPTSDIATEILYLIGVKKIHGGYIVPWEKLDLSDPKKPRLLCSIDELKILSEQQQESEYN
ncbi:hypothetical protein [Fischerella sp. JS2]|uniref:hypothetical protein n=1 Tax=Fischerella sp. JS2 TaxID=2597771 RepID=UPI0028EAEF47|nr:hypothetical protein [Fischerella sp. JS2]